MRNLSLIIGSLLLGLWTSFDLFAQTNSNHVHVDGYYRSNGTYVAPHYRTAPNSTNRDNFSTLGNTNPYTNQPGWIAPDNKVLYSSPTFDNTQPSSNIPSKSPLSGLYDESYDLMKKRHKRELEDLERQLEDSRNSRTPKPFSSQPVTPYHNATGTIKAIDYHDRYSYEGKLSIEKLLKKLGYDAGLIDGIIDRKTINAICSLQEDFQLNVDGQVGPATLEILSH